MIGIDDASLSCIVRVIRDDVMMLSLICSETFCAAMAVCIVRS